MRDAASVKEAADRAVQERGRLDIWVNNAGVYPVYAPLEMTLADWNAVLALNLSGVLLGAQDAARHMIAAGHGGVIVNIASTTGLRAGSAGSTAFTASKHGVVGLTKSLAVGLAPHDIRVLAVAPGVTMTPGLQVLREEFGRTIGGDIGARSADRVLLGRPALPDEVARVVLFCASSLAAYMTGTVIPVDGGDLAA